MNERIYRINTGITNTYIIQGETCVLVDCGTTGKAGLIRKRLKKRGIKPEEISLIILTHTHWDHVGSLAELAEMTGAKVVVHNLEYERLRDGIAVYPSGVTPWGRFLAKSILLKLLPETLPPYDADIVVEGSLPLRDYGIQGDLVHTPGHSPGSMSLILDDRRAFVGDMAMNAFPLRLTPGLPIFGELPDKIIPSWERIIKSGAETVYPAHGRPFNIKKIIAAIMRKEKHTEA